MKKSIQAILFLIFSLTLVLAGCGAGQTSVQENENASSSNPPASSNTYLSVGGSTSGSTAFAYSVAIGNIVSKYNPEIKLQIQETSGTVEGVTLLQGNVLDMLFQHQTRHPML